MAGPSVQTSVRLSPNAVAALRAVSATRALSRDATVRALLDEYTVSQLTLREDERLTHMSTVLRFPPPPLARTEKDNRIRVAFRLDAGVAKRASSLALRLPGQPHARGPRHYSPRPLTDAVAVAIASVSPYTDDGLEDLPHLITHGAAIALWRLTVAATLTRAEQRVILTAPGSDLAMILDEEDVAWHAPLRFAVALHLARRLLVGPDRAANLEMLQHQHQDYQTLRYELARTEWADSELMRDCTARPGLQQEGRGGAAVWRAERKLALEQLAAWLVSPVPSPSVKVRCPGWTLLQPRGWSAVTLAYGQQPSTGQQDDLSAGRVVRLSAGSRSAIWPYDLRGNPIARFETALAAAAGLSSSSVVELILLRTEDLGVPWAPAELACAWGLMTTEESHRLDAEASENRGRAVLAAADHWRHSEWLQAALKDAVDDPVRFGRIARQQSIRGGPFQAGCFWPVESVADVLRSGVADEQVTWLVGAIHSMRNRRLERAMERASMEAYWHGEPSADEIV